MKKFVFISVILMMILGACTQNDIAPVIEEEFPITLSTNAYSHHISLEEAASIADAYSGKTRSLSRMEIDYVLSKETTRAVVDTLA